MLRRFVWVAALALLAALAYFVLAPVPVEPIAWQAPQARVILANVPGYPDNLMRGMDGRIWLGFTKPRGAGVDKMAGTPFLRRVTYRLPKSLWPVPPAYGHVFAFDEDGRVAADLQDPAGSYPETTGVTETADRLYIQSLHASSLGWMPKSDAGLSAAK